MANNASGGTTTSFTNAHQAVADNFLLTEDDIGNFTFDVMANDLGGKAKTLWSIDNGTNESFAMSGYVAGDLLTQDTTRTEALSTDTSFHGAKIWITEDGKVGYDSSHLTANFKAELQSLGAGEEITDTFIYAIQLGKGTLSWQTATIHFNGTDDPTVITGDSTAALTESNVAQSTGGTLIATDPDSSNAFVVQTGVDGDHGYGTFSIGTDGVWTYTMNGPHDEFVADVDYTDSITVATADGTEQIITVTITGSMDRMPDDTLTVVSSSFASWSYLYGDDGLFNDNVNGGNDTLTAIDSGPYSGSDIYGDVYDIKDSARGGNDTLTAINSGLHSISHLSGDCYTLSGTAIGGNDVLTAINSGGYQPYWEEGPYASLYGDASGEMRESAQGGSDTLTAINSSQTSYANLVGDAFNLYDSSQGGNDTLTATNSGLTSYAFLFGDAYYMDDNARFGNDTLTVTSSGDESWSRLYGDAFQLYKFSQGGNDTLSATNSGSYSYSDLLGDAEYLNYGDLLDASAQGGNDILTVINSGEASYSYLRGDAVNLLNSAQGGDDVLTAANSGNDSWSRLYGDAEGMSGHSKGGNDTLSVTGSSSSLSSELFGDADRMLHSTQGGNDILNGGNGNDSLWGDARYYISLSSPGSITGGIDALNGGTGADQLWGGPNNDTFVFNVGSSDDVIYDFNQGNLVVGSTAPEHDILDVHDYGFIDWNALQAAINDDSYGNAVIQLSANNSITLLGVHTAELNSTDFIL